MEDRQQQQRDRAYKIWEDEGRPDGLHDEHWKRAEEQHEQAEKDVEDVTKVNQQADDAFAKGERGPDSTATVRPPSTVSAD